MRLANIYIGLVLAAGCAILYQGLSHWGSYNWVSYLAYLAIALLASGLKVTLPVVKGTMSTGFLFVLIGISQMSLGQTLALGCLGILVQTVFHAKVRPRPIQLAFNVASLACSIQAAYGIYHTSVLEAGSLDVPLRLLFAATAYFIVNTLSVAIVIALTESKRPWAVWRDTYFWTYPNYLLGAAVAWGVNIATRLGGAQAPLLLLPVLFFVYRSHSLYVQRLEEEKQRAEEQRAHAEEVAALHRRTIETLAIAIEAKDQTTAEHLERVEIYALEVGKELGLSSIELEALRASALLHDIGKLGVPEYIISKPGKLTPEEFEKMKTHTVVGAEIVERIQFPYPVAPIVRSHHERWNGTGYPDGLAGEQIPIGARILGAVDCLDALASDRQYRRALPLEEAIKVVQAESGKSYDPRVVEVLSRRYIELERIARTSGQAARAKLSTHLKIERGAAPGAGFEATGSHAIPNSQDLANIHRSIEEADSEARTLAGITRALDGCADDGAVYEVLRERLRSLVPYKAMVVYIRQQQRLIPKAVDGEDHQLFISLEIPLGMGLSGWVAENRKSIFNGNPSVEPGYLSDPTKFSTLGSALAIPLEHNDGVFGVLSLYRLERDAFTKKDHTLLLAVGTLLGRSGDLLISRRVRGGAVSL
jgi:putative nucleotidyltransferase with HDIG domain